MERNYHLHNGIIFFVLDLWVYPHTSSFVCYIVASIERPCFSVCPVCLSSLHLLSLSVFFPLLYSNRIYCVDLPSFVCLHALYLWKLICTHKTQQKTTSFYSYRHVSVWLFTSPCLLLLSASSVFQPYHARIIHVVCHRRLVSYLLFVHRVVC